MHLQQLYMPRPGHPDKSQVANTMGGPIPLYPGFEGPAGISSARASWILCATGLMPTQQHRHHQRQQTKKSQKHTGSEQLHSSLPWIMFGLATPGHRHYQHITFQVTSKLSKSLLFFQLLLKLLQQLLCIP